MIAMKRCWWVIVILIFSSCETDSETSDQDENGGVKELITAEDMLTNIGGNKFNAVLRYNYSTLEIEVLDLINDYRISKGLNELQLNDQISFISEGHDLYMINNDVVNHNNFSDRANLIESKLGATRVGENVAYNYLSAQAVVKAWIQSESHRKNLEGDYTHFGLAAKVNPQTGKTYYTNLFAKI